MIAFKLFLLISIYTCTSQNVYSQDVLLNILTQNSGMVKKRESVFLEVTVCNTSSTANVPVYKLKPQISFPSEFVSIPDTGHILPHGWAISSIDGSVIRLSNGSDVIPARGCRTILILMKGINNGGPSTISGNLHFSNGISPGSLPGNPTPGDNPADNVSTSTIKVIE